MKLFKVEFIKNNSTWREGISTMSDLLDVILAILCAVVISMGSEFIRNVTMITLLALIFWRTK